MPPGMAAWPAEGLLHAANRYYMRRLFPDPIMKQEFRLMMKFRGVRGSIPTPTPENLWFGGNTACVEVRSAANDLLVIDGGTGARKLGLALSEEFGDQPLDIHFLMTHFHWDHIQGLPYFVPLYASANRITFHAGRSPEATREILEGQMLEPYYPIGFDVLAARREFVEAGDQITRQGSMTIHPFPMNHPQGAYGYRIEADGASIVHASDVEHGNPRLDSVLREYAQDADVLIYDAQYSPEEYASKAGWGHSTWLEATQVARDARVKQLILFHHDPGHDDACMREFVTRARTHFENTDAAREGSIICI